MKDAVCLNDKDAALESLIARVADEYLDRVEQGDQPDPDEYVRLHPELASVLTQILPALQLMRSISAPVIACSEAVTAGGPNRGCLGDFRLLREIGRGGMGIVYEAEQISLGRRVALKVLRFAGGLEAKHLQRFKNEAQAAAQLHHTNIVPVFAVGEERGVHYYAMQFINGQTLAALIRELRQVHGLDTAEEAGSSDLPMNSGNRASLDLERDQRSARLDLPTAAETVPPAGQLTDRSTGRKEFFRTVARMGIQAAAALEHAHQQGVVHRDIKPANLLIDGRGNLWITDFGLARFQRDTGLTLTGDVLGTLRYMSPEQALARHTLIDHRTDIYSLGATLYELLTLHPVLEGADRHDLIRQIANEDPKPLRRVKRDIPEELETIVLKSLAKNPEERYATAQEMENDLQRFLEDRPVLARRPSLVQRGAKWIRRHKPMVGAAAGLLMLALVLSVISSILIWREKGRTDAAYQREQGERRKAEGNLRLALQSLDELCLKVAEKQLPRDPQREREDRENLQKALHFYEEFARNNSDEPGVRQETAKAYLRVGFIQQKLGQSERAEQSYNQALALLGALASRYPDELIYKQELARGHHNLSRLQAATGRFCDALASCEMALRLRQRLARDFSNNPELCKDLANSFLRMGNLLKIMERHGEAKEAYRQALQQFEKLAEDSTGPDYQQGVASCLNNLGILMVESGDMVEAEKAHRRAVDLYLDLVKEHPDAPDYQQELAACQINLANLLKKTNRSNEAERVCLEAIDRWEELIEGYPMVPGYKQELADSYHNLGIFYQETERVTEAEKAFLDSVALYDQLKDDFPNSSKYCRNLATTLYRLALLVRDPHQPIALHQFGPLNGNLRSGGDSKCPGPGKDPMAPAVLGTQAAGHGSRKDKGKKSADSAVRNGTCRACAKADTLPRTNQTRLDMARHYFGRAHDQYVEALRRSDNDAFSQNNLAWFLVTCPDESFRDVDKAVQLAQSVVKVFPGVGTFWNTLGVVHYRRGEWKEAAVALKESIRLHPSGGDSFDWFFLAMAHHRLGDRTQARQFYDKAVEWMEKHQEFVEELTRFRAEAAALMASESGPSNNSGPYKG